MSQSSADGGETTMRIDRDVLEEIKMYKVAIGARSNQEALRQLLPPYGSDTVDIEALEDLAGLADDVEENTERIESLEEDQETFWAAVNDLRGRVTDVEGAVEE